METELENKDLNTLAILWLFNCDIYIIFWTWNCYLCTRLP